MFSVETKFHIKERAKYVSELSGDSDRPFHCSHFNHDKKNPEEYNSEGMGFLITDIEHFEYHYRFLRNPERIGLTKRENRSALRELLKQIYTHDLTPAEIIAEKMIEARTMWEDFFQEESPKSREPIPPLAI